MRYLVNILAGLLLGITAAKAQQIEESYGIICDTVEQVKYYGAIDSNDGLRLTNDHFRTPEIGSVCGEGSIRYFHGREMDKMTTPHGHILHIFEIGVVEMYLRKDGKDTWVAQHPPLIQYAPFTFDIEEGKGA